MGHTEYNKDTCTLRFQNLWTVRILMTTVREYQSRISRFYVPLYSLFQGVTLWTNYLPLLTHLILTMEGFHFRLVLIRTNRDLNSVRLYSFKTKKIHRNENLGHLKGKRTSTHVMTEVLLTS